MGAGSRVAVFRYEAWGFVVVKGCFGELGLSFFWGLLDSCYPFFR